MFGEGTFLRAIPNCEEIYSGTSKLRADLMMGLEYKKYTKEGVTEFKDRVLQVGTETN